MTEPTKFVESNAILYALSGADEDLHAALDTMTKMEMRHLCRAANRLRLTIWVRLGRPYSGGRDAAPIPDPRIVHERRPAPAVEPGGLVWFCAVCDGPRGSAGYGEPCPACGSTAVRSGAISGRGLAGQ